MTILAIDSSALPVSCALIQDGHMTAEFTISIKLTHSETLMPLLDDMLKSAGMGLDEVDALAVSKGPGSFTGLRIGTATVKGLAMALDKPVIPVPTLEAMAFNIFGTDALIVPMMDARRKNVYAAIYEYREGELSEIMPQSALSLISLMEKVNASDRKTVFTGDGIYSFKEDLEAGVRVPYSLAPPHLCMQRAGAVGALGEIYFNKGIFTDAGSFRPDYIKASQAEKEKKEAEESGRLRELSAGGHSLYV